MENVTTNALDALLKDPALLQRLSASLGALTPSPQASEAGTDMPSTPPSSPLLTDGIASVLSDPQLSEKLPQMIALLRPMLGGEAPTQASHKESAAKESTPTLAPTSMHAEHRSASCRDDLLLALKPFLSRERCETVDMIIRLSRLGNVLKALQ